MQIVAYAEGWAYTPEIICKKLHIKIIKKGNKRGRNG